MRRKISGTCILIMLMISSATSQQPPNASIEGTVVDIETGQPIPGARLVLTRPAAVPAGLMPPPILVTITNREGRFEFAALDAGSYRLAVAADGYVRQEFSQMPLNLSAGQTLKDVLLRLTSTGTVAGVIRTNSGKPAAGVQIQLVSPRYGPGGERRLVAAGAAKTNDRGEYRLYWITPGRYYVVAGSLDALGSSFQSVESGGLGGSPNEYQSTGYGVTFDSGRFALTDVAPGDYKLFAWEALDPYAYFDPKILEPFEQQGKPVHVAESTTANVEVEIIPARSTR